jgi:hypothetical protein
MELLMVPKMRVQPVQEKGRLWLVGINAIGNPLKANSPKQAQELSMRLRQIGETELGVEISGAAQKAHRANGNA